MTPRRDAVVVPHPDEGSEDPVLPGMDAKLGERLLLTPRLGQCESSSQENRARHGGLDQLVEAAIAEELQHGLLVPFARAQMPRREGIEGGEGRAGGLRLGPGGIDRHLFASRIR